MRTNMKTVKIWDKQIGDGFRPYFVAELGTCHQGSVEIAKKNVTAAVKAGADCIKTETFYETEVFDSSAKKNFHIRGKQYSLPLIEHMRACQLTLDEHHEIKNFCDEMNVPFMATAHDRERVDFLVDIGAVAVKIASPDIVHYPLIEYAAKSGLVLLLDTGGAYQHEVEMAVKAARDAGCTQLIVNHNPDGHPAPANKHNLRIIQRYKELFDIPIGISDHYDGYEMVYTAATIGANLIEKPISQDRFIEECEHIWAISVKDLDEVITKMHLAYDALGDKQRPMEAGFRPASPHRVALLANKNLSAGDIISEDNIVFGKPRLGIGVENWHLVKGKQLKQAKTKHAYILWEDIE